MSGIFDLPRRMLENETYGRALDGLSLLSCLSWGKDGDCPRRMGVESVETLRACLPSALVDVGLSTEFNAVDSTGNPARSREVDRYIAVLKRKIAVSRVSQPPKAAR